MTTNDAEKLCRLLNAVLSDRYWQADLRDALKEAFPDIPWRCVYREGAPAGKDRTLILAGPDNTTERECDEWPPIGWPQPAEQTCSPPQTV